MSPQEHAHRLVKERRYAEAERIWRELSALGSLEAGIELAAVLDRQNPGSHEAVALVDSAARLVKDTDHWIHYLLYLSMCCRDIGDSDFVRRQTTGYRHLALAATPPDGLPIAMLEMATSHARGTAAFARDFDTSETWYRLAEKSADPEVRKDAMAGLKELDRLRRAKKR